ncbi:uncharacterized protein MONBRDRAFT_25176 [Monosiga brevicollis MX1]|uniref:ATP-grasp domain-containing protein n=1 Tax=Monosiga brevicollis TaxID=81824 RepID=A9UYM4_MONBE|nr:uncharacterized protein MONBRDRAFT_25176 [Monosiga brevicollis MX1]EDQ89489.1 predicted protein [Monosiga brevicollis MX1]|eukprot:XP_001745518.1 hypothetical protein [Monosiga brevicollis MX1]
MSLPSRPATGIFLCLCHGSKQARAALPPSALWPHTPRSITTRNTLTFNNTALATATASASFLQYQWHRNLDSSSLSQLPYTTSIMTTLADGLSLDTLPSESSATMTTATTTSSSPTTTTTKRANTVCHGIVDSLEAKLPEKWWETLFDEMYLKTDGDVVENADITADEVDAILNAVALPDQAAVLDLCCGQGRHLLELSQRRSDLQLFGLDQSAFLIQTAQARADASQKNVHFTVGTCDALPYEANSFDLVTIMGNSFGYFERAEVDQIVIAEVQRVLKPGGTVLLDLTDGEHMKNTFSPRSWEWIDDTLLVCRERQLASDGRRLVSREVITDTNKGVVRDQFYAERLYTFPELRAVLEKASFVGPRQIDILTGEKSDRGGQDLGMMAHRMFIRASKAPTEVQLLTMGTQASLPIETTDTASEQTISGVSTPGTAKLVVVMGDPSRPSSEKLNQTWNDEDLLTIEKLKGVVLERFQQDREVVFLNHHDSMFEALTALAREHIPPVIFNLCDEGFNNHARLELHVPAMMDILGLHYSGAAPACLAICYDKGLVNALARRLGVPVPAEVFISHETDLRQLLIDEAAATEFLQDLDFPVFVKPVRGDGSVGITADSICNNVEELISYVEAVRANPTVLSKDVVVQEYLQGEEVSVGVIGNPEMDAVGDVIPDSALFLPILKADFSQLPADLPPILSYESKWDPESPYWTDVQYKPAEVSAEHRRQLHQQCALLFNRFELRDFGRFDFRFSKRTQTFKLLEVNPNPGWCHDGKAALMAQMAGLNYADMIQRIILAAEARIEKARNAQWKL